MIQLLFAFNKFYNFISDLISWLCKINKVEFLLIFYYWLISVKYDISILEIMISDVNDSLVRGLFEFPIWGPLTWIKVCYVTVFVCETDDYLLDFVLFNHEVA